MPTHPDRPMDIGDDSLDEHRSGDEHANHHAGQPAVEAEGQVTDDQITQVQGKVKWFDTKKGFGFIIGPAGQDIFVHYSVIQRHGFRALNDGDGVRYSAQRSEKGWKATRVEPLDAPEVVVPRRRPTGVTT